MANRDVHRLAEVAVAVETVSSLISLLSRKFTGKLANHPLPVTPFPSDTTACSMSWSQIPCAREQGIFLKRTGNFEDVSEKRSAHAPTREGRFPHRSNASTPISLPPSTWIVRTWALGPLSGRTADPLTLCAHALYSLRSPRR